MNIADYLNLITSEYVGQPNYTAMISLDVSFLVQMQSVFSSMIPLFNIDQAVGQQQDFIGQWVGISRNVSIPAAGIWFSWDDVDSDGWDFGSWQPSTAPANITTLPDDAYLTLLRAKIAANRWNGTIEGAYAIWAAVFPQYEILIIDYQNMSYAMAIIGSIVDSLTLALLTEGYLPLRPEGVKITEYFVATDTNPAFAWDLESAQLAGWDEGSWLKEILV